MLEKYYSPTPKKWKKIGDSIMIGCSSLSAIMMGSPLTDTEIKWIVFILNIIGIVGKILTNLPKEDEDNKSEPITELTITEPNKK